jgi:hypothetical protein
MVLMRNQNVIWAAFFLVQNFAQMRLKDNFSLFTKYPFLKEKKLIMFKDAL